MYGWMIKMFLIFLLSGLAPSFTCAEGKEFRLGVISGHPVERVEEYGPLVSYVAKRLQKFSITDGRVLVAEEIEDMIEKIRKKEVDVVFESAFPTIEMRKKTGMIPHLLVWKKGGSEYRSVIFVRRESPIRRLNDLKGKTIVFEDHKSTSAYLLPKAELKRNGLIVLPLNEKGSRSAVHFVFGGEEVNQAFWVIQKRADAGAFSSDDWDELAKGPKSELRIIHETRSVLRFIASFHPAVPAELREAVSDILTEMDHDPEGRRILQQAARTERIERLSDRDHQTLEYVRDLMSILDR